MFGDYMLGWKNRQIRTGTYNTTGTQVEVLEQQYPAPAIAEQRQLDLVDKSALSVLWTALEDDDITILIVLLSGFQNRVLIFENRSFQRHLWPLLTKLLVNHQNRLAAEYHVPHTGGQRKNHMLSSDSVNTQTNKIMSHTGM